MYSHSHISAEHHNILEEEYQFMGEHNDACHFRMISEHRNHGPVRFETGALVLLVWESTPAS